MATEGEMNKAVFLDRDGTINIEKEYLYKPEDFELLDGATQAISSMNKLGYKVVIITNQSGIARGYYTEEDVRKLHCYMKKTLAMKNAKIDAVYYCPHHPQASVDRYRIDCDCRKPQTGLFKRAISELNIDAEQSWAAGDRMRDITPAMELGIKSVLILTGYGKSEDLRLAPAYVRDLSEFADLLNSVNG